MHLSDCISYRFITTVIYLICTLYKVNEIFKNLYIQIQDHVDLMCLDL